MLSGHQGASARTDCCIARVASCVAGSSQDSGRCTMRLGSRMRSTLGRRAECAATSRSSACCWVSAPASKWICSERMPGVRSRMPADARCVCSSSSSACTWKRSTRSSSGAPNSTSRLSSPPGDAHAAVRMHDFATRAGCGRGRAGRHSVAMQRLRWHCPVRSARGRFGACARKRTLVAGPQLAQLPQSASTTVAGQTKPPRLGPSGPRITGMSPVKSMLPMA